MSKTTHLGMVTIPHIKMVMTGGWFMALGIAHITKSSSTKTHKVDVKQQLQEKLPFTQALPDKYRNP